MIEAVRNKIPDRVFNELLLIKELDSPERIAHFLSQCHHESGFFRHTTESLRYSAQRLVEIFPKYFTWERARRYALQEEKIANLVYGRRMGNTEPGDGWKYRGRGYLQLTGKRNYQRFSNHIAQDCVSNPDLVATHYPLQSAAWFFTHRNIWNVCDEGTVRDVTLLINGGTIGLPQRQTLYNRYLSFFK